MARLIDFEKARESVMDILAGKVSSVTAIKVSSAMKEATVDAVEVVRWIPVSEQLPIEEAIAFEEEWDDYPEFLVMIDGGYLPTTLYYDWEENEWFKINTALEREAYKVTHWQCLPHPPKGE